MAKLKLIARTQEEYREIFLAMVRILRLAGTHGENFRVIRALLPDMALYKIGFVLRMSSALHLIVGYGRTQGRRYVLTALGNAVASALEEGRKARGEADIEGLREAFERVLETYN